MAGKHVVSYDYRDTVEGTYPACVFNSRAGPKHIGVLAQPASNLSLAGAMDPATANRGRGTALPTPTTTSLRSRYLAEISSLARGGAKDPMTDTALSGDDDPYAGARVLGTERDRERVKPRASIGGVTGLGVNSSWLLPGAGGVDAAETRLPARSPLGRGVGAGMEGGEPTDGIVGGRQGEVGRNERRQSYASTADRAEKRWWGPSQDNVVR